MDQDGIRRRGVGIIGRDPESICDGLVLFMPYNQTTCFLIDTVNGEVCHTWSLQYCPGLHAELLPNGNLFLNGRVDEESQIFPPWPQFKGGVMQEIDPAGNVLWEHFDKLHHHTGRLSHATAYETAIYLSLYEMNDEDARLVRGGYAPKEYQGPMWGDVIREVGRKGNVVWEWTPAQRIPFDKYPMAPNLPRYEWTHANTVYMSNDGCKVITSFRSISVVAIIDKASSDIVWEMCGIVTGPCMFSAQHDSQFLNDRTIILFDNGTDRPRDFITFSRVIEIDLESKKTIWTYRANPPFSFFSSTVSGCQRLKNGNTLVTEGQTGRMFQVTAEGKLVWEYVNPHFATSTGNLGWNINQVFKSFFYDYSMKRALNREK